GVPISGVRNHKFQWMGRDTTIRLEQDEKVFFDLNCVASSEATWIGTGSGIGFPIPFPPDNNKFFIYPLQIPTLFEDDVFLFDHDYCYKPFQNGDSLTVAFVLNYLQEWISNKQLPAVLNLHPEHVTPFTRVLLDKIIEWISISNLWTPTLHEFANWINDIATKKWTQS
ncbi:hypothetical protein MUP95_03220, partial [bacterium]|nr:hypothetical protein [bacterium]